MDSSSRYPTGVGQRVGSACPRACYACCDSEIGSFPCAQAGTGPRGNFGGSRRLASRLRLAGKRTRRGEELQTSALKDISASPIALAARAREVLGLKEQDPILDICELFENNGIRVHLLKRATDAFFGLSVGPEESGPAVVVNTWDRISVERWIFTAAHELGHLLLHINSFDRNEAYEPSQQEKEADAFAGHFLMPQSFFVTEWEKTSGLSLLDRVLKVKRIFRVSYKTVLHRLVESRQVDSTVWQFFKLQHRNRYGKTLGKSDEPLALVSLRRSEEPDRLSNSDFVEDRLSRLVRQAFERRLISVVRAAEILRLGLNEMRQRAKVWAT